MTVLDTHTVNVQQPNIGNEESAENRDKKIPKVSFLGNFLRRNPYTSLNSFGLLEPSIFYPKCSSLVRSDFGKLGLYSAKIQTKVNRPKSKLVTILDVDYI